MMVHSKHRAASAVRGSILCRDTLLYSASAAVPKLIISQVTILILPKPWKKLLHNVMQYSAEGRKTTILAQNQGTKITSWRNKFNLTNRNVTIIMLTCAAIHTERGSVKYNNCAKSDIK